MQLKIQGKVTRASTRRRSQQAAEKAKDDVRRLPRARGHRARSRLERDPARTPRPSAASRRRRARSAASSSPALSRMKPSGTASVPQRARRSAVVCTPPKLVASATSSHAARKRCAPRRPAARTPTHRPEAPVHLPRRDRRGRVGRAARGSARRRPGRRARERLGERQRVRALALAAARRASPASGARATPRTARRSRRSRARQRAQRARARCGVARGDVPSSRSRVAGRAPSSRSPSRCRRRARAAAGASGVASVLSTASSAPAACTSSASAAMSSTSSPGFDGVSTHTSVAPAERLARPPPRRSGTSRTSTPARLEVLARDAADAGIAVATARRARRPARAARAARRRSTAAMPDANTTRLAALELAERGLVVRPRRVAVAPVAVRGASASPARWNGAANVGPGRNGSPCSGAGSPAWTTRVRGPCSRPAHSSRSPPLGATRRRTAWSRECPQRHSAIGRRPRAPPRAAVDVDQPDRPGDLVRPVVADLDLDLRHRGEG